jgi:hypothetical protein
MTLKALAAASCLSMAMATGATAATLTIDSGQLTGATDVDVDGTLYDVAFVDGTCAALFDGCDSVDDFTFTTFETAAAASQALLDQVLIDTDDFLFDTRPNLTYGCFAESCATFTPFAFTRGGVEFAEAFNAPFFGDDGSRAFAFGQRERIEHGAFRTSGNVAVWTEASPAPVPLPAGGLLLLGGLGGFAALKRRKKRAA